MLLLRSQLKIFHYLGVIIAPLLVAQAWVIYPGNCNKNLITSGRFFSIKPSVALQATGENDEPSSSEDESNEDSSHDEKQTREHRLAKAKNDIDRILNNPVDPPFDFENEIKKVASISPPLIQEGSAEYQLEEQVSEVEEQLYDAIKNQDYASAAKKSFEISQMHVDDCGLVLQANSAFYRAFRDKNVRDMEHIWLNDRSCICIHPSFEPLSGVVDIMSTYKRMFESSVGSFQRTWIDPCDIQLSVKGTTAVITCVENVYARRFVRGKRRKSELVNKLTATNIYRKVGGRWYMTYHHSSWHADSEAAKSALRTIDKGIKGRSSVFRKTVSTGPSGESLLNLASLSKDTEDDNNDDEDTSNIPTELESILGIENFGPILGSESRQGQEDLSTGPKFMSSNLDFLKDLGNIDGMLGLSTTNGESMGLPPGSIIRISKINEKGDDHGHDLNDIDKDDFGEAEDTNNNGDKSILELLANRKKEKKKVLDNKSIRFKCIDELRRLSKLGRISTNQKRVLLTDIISCSARGEKSLVEHAYKLLCGDGTEEEAIEEEFVDQCQVFAQSFFESS